MEGQGHAVGVSAMELEHFDDYSKTIQPYHSIQPSEHQTRFRGAIGKGYSDVVLAYFCLPHEI
jgi:hypothetical protein